MDPSKRITLEEYHRLIKTGILMDGEPIELIEGYLIEKLPRGPRHDCAKSVLIKRLVLMELGDWCVRPTCAVTLSADSEPEPDSAVVRDIVGGYRDHHPGPTEIGLVIEVSAPSLDFDRSTKGRIYARDRIPVYWVVNVVDRRVEVYTQPGGTADAPAYLQRQDYIPGSSVPVGLDGQTVGSIAVSDLLGERGLAAERDPGLEIDRGVGWNGLTRPSAT